MTEKNAGYYATLDENFKIAYDLLKENQTHDELIQMLESGNIVQKQLAALKLDSINSKKEAKALIDNLTGQDGKIREAVSAKIAEFVTNDNLKDFFEPEKNIDIFLAAIIDINGNVCRNIISALSNLKKNEDFSRKFCDKLLGKTLNLAEEIKDFDFQEGKYKVNKEVFKLYWYLETIFEFYQFTDIEQLKKVLNITKSINEYTIREKTAKILSRNFNDENLTEMMQLLKNDTNYYVRRF